MTGMKKILLVYFIPLFIAVFLLFQFHSLLNACFFEQEELPAPMSAQNYYGSLKDYPAFAENFLNESFPVIYMLGSSELTESNEAIPYNFISAHFKTKVIGIGHEGNQCLSMFTQLLANENRLKDASLVILLSPGWFQSESSWGTASASLLEFNPPAFFKAIAENDSSLNYREYEAKRIADIYYEIVNPDLSLTCLFSEGQSSKTLVHKSLYYPLLQANKQLAGFNRFLYGKRKKQIHFPTHTQTPVSKNVKINWDSLLSFSRQKQLGACNNEWYIDSVYYNKFIKEKNGRVATVPESANRELQDFKILVKLLKERGAKASFIILPLNPYYYKNINELSPVINYLVSDISQKKFPCLNFWNTDITAFDKGVLRDVMHLSSYGWYRVDEFIAKTYHLTK